MGSGDILVFKGILSGGEQMLQGGGPPLEHEHDQTIISLLLNRFFSPTPEMKARDQAVPKHHRNKESVEWLQKYCMIHSDDCSQNWVQYGHFALFT